MSIVRLGAAVGRRCPEYFAALIAQGEKKNRLA